MNEVQMRLSGPDAIADSSISMIVSLISQEQLGNQLENAEIHARGLQQIVRLRGGISSLEGNFPLALQVCKSDIMLSLQLGKSTIFFRDNMPDLATQQELIFDPFMIPGSVASGYYHVGSTLQKIFSDVMRFCAMMNAEIRTTSLDFLGFEEILISICYRLLKFRSLNELKNNPDIHSMFHLGLTVFTMSTFLQFDRHKIISHRFLSTCLQEVSRFQSYGNQDHLNFWFLMVGGIWVANDEDGDWAICTIRETTHRQGITTWNQARSILCMFPWIHGLHDQPGYDLWTRAQANQEKIEFTVPGR
ncbi:uncharacterized protein N7483_002870 [Penicillium malachiteum]|uniref:uncharacterized protein n=1 Tax=Penicillium malachiteum TaxID=1324776 RepID=UPI0025495144|nr:uncharacterized protein N7483_002870 [Penicillium malachiteum]KAJ5737745.1 hypothetical protein N7483_002870 [Penicillium malachiteum]